jgi:type VI secretion system protein VasG
VDTIAARCKDVDTGARNADHIITGTVLTMISAEVLTRMAENKPVKTVSVDVDGKSQFAVTVE